MGRYHGRREMRAGVEGECRGRGSGVRSSAHQLITRSILAHMQKRWLHLIAFGILLVFPLFLLAGNRETGEVKLIELSEPQYPPIAQAARVSGKVELNILVRPEGEVASVEVISGPAMLRQAALESARASRFSCVDCGVSNHRYLLGYDFQVLESDPEEYCAGREKEAPPPQLDETRHRVSVFMRQIWTCDPARAKRRAIRCLYLWHCGWH